MVLLLIGIAIALPHLCRFFFSPSKAPQAPPGRAPRLLWLATPDGQEDGLYWLAGAAANWPQLVAASNHPRQGMNRDLALHLPEEGSPRSVDKLLPAYLLAGQLPPQPIPIPVRVAPIFFRKIPINQADLEALITIPGIGRRLAATIIAYRERTGGIKDRAALMGIEGIGDKKAAIIAAHVRFDPPGLGAGDGL
jgi:hypothetical protein